MPSEKMHPSETMRFGKYALIEKISVGPHGEEVFLARQAGLEKTIALKRIASERIPSDSIRETLHKAKMAAQLHHPNLVQIYDIGKMDGVYFIAMEYIFGRNMRRILPKADSMGVCIPIAYSLRIASSVCDALYYTHERTDLYGNALNIVHREISPEHIFVSFDGTVKVKLSSLGVGEKTTEKSYQSPEQYAGESLDPRSDLFSLGAVLYECVTGYKLFPGPEEAVCKAIMDGKVPAPSSFKPGIPESVERILLKALCRKKNERYENARQMQQDIDCFLSQYEFMPSNSHLASFLKQLFSDELEKEKKQLMACGSHSNYMREILDLLDDESSCAVQLIPLRPKAERSDSSYTDNSEKVLTVCVEAAVYETIKVIAERNCIPIGTLLRDVLASYVKYK